MVWRNTAPLRARKVRRTPDKSSTGATNRLLILIGPNKTSEPCGGIGRWSLSLTKTLELLKPGDFRDKAGYLGVEQQLPADATVDVFFLADLKKILDRYGNRGYRATLTPAPSRVSERNGGCFTI